MEYDEEVMTGWGLWNATDHVFADPRTFATREQAVEAAAQFRARFKVQGYYKTAEGLRIDPSEVELEVVPMGN